MTNEQKIFTAVCGQKCGTVQVPGADTTNCPQCGHPLTEVPQAMTVAAEPAGGEHCTDVPPTIAGAPVVPIAPPIVPGRIPDLTTMLSGMLETIPEDRRPELVESIISAGLRLAGYTNNEADEMAASAVEQIGKRKTAANGN